MRHIPAVTLLTFALASSQAARAEMLVVKASGGAEHRFKTGAALSDKIRMRLAKGERLTVLVKGRTLVLTGPIDGTAREVEVKYANRAAVAPARPRPAVRNGAIR